MRLQKLQIELINTLVARHLGYGCDPYLFGSRLDDNAKGGDVDLYVETPKKISRLLKARLKASLEKELGLPVDLIVESVSSIPSSFVSIIRADAVSLRQKGKDERTIC